MSTRFSFTSFAAALLLALAAGLLPSKARAINEIATACQLPGAYLTETGLERLVRTGVLNLATAFLNPVDDFTTRQKKKLQKAAAMLAGGVTAMTLCPPLVVPEGFSAWPMEDREDYAISNAWDLRGISDMSFDVDNPSDPQSCRKTLTTSLNGSGQMLEGRDFTELEFVYVEPFGSFPSAVGLYDAVAEEIREEVEGLLNQYLPNLEPFETPIQGIADFTDLIDGFLASIGLNPNLSLFIPDIEDWLLDIIGLALAPSCDSVDLECEFLRDFDLWGTDLLDLVADGVVTRPAADLFGFPDGASQVVFDSDINTGFSTEIVYVQDIFVKEYFPPTFDVIAVEADPAGGPDLNVIADFVFEALEPGRAVTRFTPPSSQLGQIAVQDNCDPSPELIGGIPPELPLGVHYLEVSAEDRTFNVVGRPGQDPLCPTAADPNNPNDNPACEKYVIKVTVTDTRPPHLLPPDPIGGPVSILAGSQVGFTDFGVGCLSSNCQLVNPSARVFPPPLFDFASDSTTIDVQCAVTNALGSNVPCAIADLPVNDSSELEWTLSDSSGNSSVVSQLVAVRTIGTNQPPVADGTVVEVGANTTAPIALVASDPEFDPISFDVRSLPLNGTLNVNPDPIFQTRVSLTGTLTDLTDAVHVRGELDNNRFANVLADPVGRRLLAVNDIKVIDALYFDSIRPDSITLRDSDFVFGDEVFNQPGGTPSALTANLLVGDWTQRRIYGLVDNPAGNEPVVIPDAGLALPAQIANPAHFEMIGNRLYITDPDPVDPSLGELHVIALGNVSTATTPAQWTISNITTTALGFNATGISLPAPITGCPVFSTTTTLLLGDWNRSEVHLVALSAGDVASSQFVWNIGAYTADPGGEARPDLGSPHPSRSARSSSTMPTRTSRAWS